MLFFPVLGELLAQCFFCIWGGLLFGGLCARPRFNPDLQIGCACFQRSQLIEDMSKSRRFQPYPSTTIDKTINTVDRCVGMKKEGCERRHKRRSRFFCLFPHFYWLTTLAGYCVCRTTVPCSTRFFVVAPSDEKTVIGLKVGGGRPLYGKLRMCAFCRCVDWPKKRMDRPSIFYSSREHFFFTMVPYHGSEWWGPC